MHALEGLIAAIVLFFYFSSASFPPLQINDWTYNSMKQAGTEYITSIEKSDASELIVQDSRVFSKITNALFETSDISIIKGGILPKDLLVGLLGRSGNSTIVLGGTPRPYNGWCRSNGWHPDAIYRSDCIENTTNGLGYRTVLVDLDGDDVYDAVYVDLDDDGLYDAPFEGPFFEDGYVNIGTNNYYIKYIDSDEESINFVNITSFNYFKNVQNVTINGRNTRFIYYVADMSGDISQYDVILITDPIDLTSYLPKLKNFLLSGKGIVEVVNMTDSNYNLAQKDLFGLVNASYGVIGNGNEAILSESVRSVSEPLRIKDYFSGIPIRAEVSIPTAAYDVFGISMPNNVRVGFLNLTSGDISIAIANISGIYSSFYVDSNIDYNFSNPPEDETPYVVGNSINTTSHEYVIKSIDPNGNYVDVRPSLNATLTNFFNPLLIIPNEDSWAVAEQVNSYHDNAMSLFESFNISFSELPVLGDNTTLLAGNHKYGRINHTESYLIYLSGSPVLGNPATLPPGIPSYASTTTPFFDREYNISVTDNFGVFKLNIDLNENLAYDDAGEGHNNNTNFPAGSGTYRVVILSQNFTNFTRFSMIFNASITNVSGSLFLNVDLNNDLTYNGVGEGPFADNDVLKIGPERYRMDIAPDGYSAKFTIYARDAVPAAIAGNKYTGRTVWMPDMAKGRADSWNYLVAAMLWASPKNEDVLKSSGYRNIVSSKKVFLNTDDVFQPYIVEFSRRYG